MFIELFETTIHNNPYLAPVQKMQYLLNYLDGDAMKCISNIGISNDNYPVAMDMLRMRFGNKRRICREYVVNILDLPRMKTKSAAGILNIISVLNTSLHGLQRFNYDTSSWDPIILECVTSKLDNESRERFDESLEDLTDIPSIDTLIRFLEKRYRVLLNCLPLSKNERSNERAETRTVSRKALGKDLKRCAMCDSTKHTVWKCAEFQQLSVKQRIQLIKCKDVCYKCLRKHTGNCRLRCKDCNGKHNSLLHAGESTEESPATKQGSSQLTISGKQSEVSSHVPVNVQVPRIGLDSQSSQRTNSVAATPGAVPYSGHNRIRNESVAVSCFPAVASRVPNSEHNSPSAADSDSPDAAKVFDRGHSRSQLDPESTWRSTDIADESQNGETQTRIFPDACWKAPGAPDVPNSGRISPQPGVVVAGVLSRENISSHRGSDTAGAVAVLCSPVISRVPDSGHDSALPAPEGGALEPSHQGGGRDRMRYESDAASCSPDDGYVVGMAHSGTVNVKNTLDPAPISNVLPTGRQVASIVPVAVPSDGRPTARYESHADEHQPVSGPIPSKRCHFLKIGLIIASHRADAAIQDFAVALGLSHQEGVDKPHISRSTLEIHHQRISWPTTGIESGLHGALQPPNLLSSWWLVPPWPRDVNITMLLTVLPRTSSIYGQSNHRSKTFIDLRINEQLLQMLCEMYLLYICSAFAATAAAFCIILRDQKKEIRPAKDAYPRCSSSSIRC